MKLTKKLLPALGMLALSTCMMVTSTFAWFSMNDSVKATNMTIGAKGDQVYLQIVAGKSMPKDEEKGTPAVNVWEDQDGLALTSAQALVSTKTELLPTNIMKSVDEAYPTAGNSSYVWVSATGETAEDGDVNTSGYQAVTQTANGPQYYLHNEFSIRLDPTAGKKEANPLKVAKVTFKGASETNDTYTIDDFGQCVSVLVVCGDNEQLYKQTGTNGVFTKVAGDAFLAAEEKTVDGSTVNMFVDEDGTGVVVSIYVFFDGDHDNCTLAKLAAATLNDKYSVEVSFTVA